MRVSEFKITSITRTMMSNSSLPRTIFCSPTVGEPDEFMSLQGALAKVGLQLKSEKGPDEFIVIDHAESPSAN